MIDQTQDAMSLIKNKDSKNAWVSLQHSLNISNLFIQSTNEWNKKGKGMKHYNKYAFIELKKKRNVYTV